jgi:predicted metal-dependent peptidase
VKYLVNYLYDYSHKQSDELEGRKITDEFGNQKQIFINTPILFKAAAERIEFLEEKVKELERIEKILKIAKEVT